MSAAIHILRPDEIDFSAYLVETEARQNVRPAGAYIDEITESIGKYTADPGMPLPWDKVRSLFRFRDGEVTLWAGVNGHGKSLLSGMVALDMICHRRKVCIASFEMKPKRTLERMLRQWAGYSPDEFMGHPDAVGSLRDLYGQLKDHANGLLWFYDQQGTISAEQMISVARYCAKELRIQDLFIDSLMKCVKAEDDYNGQKALVDELTAIARDYGTHIHLVHHIRKLENESKKPDKSDVKGTGAITDQVDNVLLVWRNKAENRKPDDPDAALICCKQRNGEWEGGINLWFDRASQQYLGEHGSPVIDWSRRVS
jgi:twinkle protein